MPNLQERCLDALRVAGVAFQSDPDGAVRVPARSHEIGDLVVAFDNDEITVYLGDLTHCHFTPGAAGDLTARDQVGECVREAVGFISGVLCDRWVIWTHPGGSGGCYLLGAQDDPMADAPLPGEEARRYLWSGRRPRDGAAYPALAPDGASIVTQRSARAVTRQETKRRKTSIRAEVAQVRRFFNDWDPLSGPADEYDCVVDKVVSALHRGVSESELVGLICSEFSEHLGSPVPQEDAAAVSKGIMDWWGRGPHA